MVMLLDYIYIYTHNAFTLEFKIKETPNVSNLIGQDQNVNPMKVTIGVGFKVCNPKVALMGQTFPVISRKYVTLV